MESLTNTTYCLWFIQAGDTANIVGYFFVTPLYFIFGLFGYIACLIAFLKEKNEDTGFGYQILVSITGICDVVAYTFSIVTLCWLADARGPGTGYDWYKSNYVCMWIAAHIGIPLCNTFVTLSMLLAVSVSSDRALAMAKPMVYKNINHGRHQKIAFGICAFIGASTSWVDCLQYYPVYNEKLGFYELVVNDKFLTSAIGSSLANIRNALRAVAAVALIVSHTLMIISYKMYANKVAEMMKTNSTLAKERAEQQKMLFQMAVCESFFRLLVMGLWINYYANMYVGETFAICESYLVAPINDALIETLDTANFYVIFLISNKFRQMVFKSVPFLKRFANTTTNPVQIQIQSNT